MHTESSKAMPREWIGRLFAHFRAIYGNKAETMWGKVEPEMLLDVWGDGLRGVDPADIRKSLETMLQSYPDYPPTLPQFQGLCRDARTRRTQSTAMLVDKTHTAMPDAIRAQLAAFKAKHVQ